MGTRSVLINNMNIMVLQGFHATTTMCVFMCVCVLNAVFLRGEYVVGWFSVLYYKGVFIASISDAVSSHPVCPRLYTHTETEEKE